MKKRQPKIEVPPGKNEKIFNLLSLFGIVAMIGMVWMNYADLPDRIPIHFGPSGKPDRYGSKMWIWLMPGIAFVMHVVMDRVRRMPHSFNYPVKITEHNAKVQYSLARAMLSIVNLIMVLLFFTIAWNMISVAMGRTSQLGMLTVVLILSLVIVPLLIYNRMAKRLG